jgi:cystathionine beta-lyase/cystathionine gamma-synthase
MDAKQYAGRLAEREEAIATACVHAGEEGADGAHPYGSLETPLVLSTAFAFDSTDEAARAFRGEAPHAIYTRWNNPTVAALEAKIAALEGAEAACATGSGVAAVFAAIASQCKAGDHVVAPRSMYGESVRLLRERLPRFGIEATFVEGADVESYRGATTARTRVLYVETPSNPMLGVADVRAIASFGRERGLVTVVDSTFATPFGQTPIALGADLVVHSMTKALCGHGDAIGGVLAGDRALVESARDLAVKGLGAVLAPMNAWLIARGTRTLAMRQARACLTAFELARRLEAHPGVARVHHPSLPSHPGHALALGQMHAFGSVLSFEVAPRGARSAREVGGRVVDALGVATHAVSLGDARTLVVHPASTTHANVPEAQRLEAGIGDGLLRYSVGLESAGDLWRDLERALQ